LGGILNDLGGKLVVLFTQIWNPVVKFRTGSGYPVTATNHSRLTNVASSRSLNANVLTNCTVKSPFSSVRRIILLKLQIAKSKILTVALHPSKTKIYELKNSYSVKRHKWTMTSEF